MKVSQTKKCKSEHHRCKTEEIPLSVFKSARKKGAKQKSVAKQNTHHGYFSLFCSAFQRFCAVPSRLSKLLLTAANFQGSMPDPTPDTDSSVYIHLSVPIGYSSLYDTSAIPKKSESFFVIDCNQIVVTSDAFTLSFPITECDKIPATKWAINFSFLLSCNNSSLHFFYKPPTNHQYTIVSYKIPFPIA